MKKPKNINSKGFINAPKVKYGIYSTHIKTVLHFESGLKIQKQSLIHGLFLTLTFNFWMSLELKTSIPFLKRPTCPPSSPLDDDLLFSVLRSQKDNQNYKNTDLISWLWKCSVKFHSQNSKKFPTKISLVFMQVRCIRKSCLV